LNAKEVIQAQPGGSEGTMTALFLALASGTIPSIPLVLGNLGVITAATYALLLLCLLGLWLERERTKGPQPRPVPVGDDQEHRLAA
jgi:hypothetical protein